VLAHVYLTRFGFPVDQPSRPASSLSGGERNRLLLAKAMLSPADLLVLDEPTNDLDIPTLEVLEDSLADFPGALVLVTHDRYLLDRVATAVLGLDGQGAAQLYADYWQWEEAGQALPKAWQAKVRLRGSGQAFTLEFIVGGWRLAGRS